MMKAHRTRRAFLDDLRARFEQAAGDLDAQMTMADLGWITILLAECIKETELPMPGPRHDD